MLILEKTRNQLVSSSIRAQKEKDGKTRYQKRLKSRISSSIREYNQLNMDKFFKQDILDVNIKVYGETGSYLVTLSFGGILDYLQDLLKHKQVIELKDIVRAISNSFNSKDVYIHCTCDDWKYRQAYYATKKKINSGNPENIPSKITNPNDTLGDGCKHVLLVLSNTSWIIKVASVINNYIKYMEKSQKRLYADYIYPAIYGKKYEKNVQLDLLNKDELDKDSSFIDKSNRYAKTKTEFKSGNPYRYPKQPNRNQQSFLDNKQEKQNND